MIDIYSAEEFPFLPLCILDFLYVTITFVSLFFNLRNTQYEGYIKYYHLH